MINNIMMNPLIYSICIFIIIALLLSVVYADKIKLSEKKHIISGLYILLGAFIHVSVLIVVELLK
jgi:hypothetical protein